MLANQTLHATRQFRRGQLLVAELMVRGICTMSISILYIPSAFELCRALEEHHHLQEGW